jgi:hypothetical protein
MKMTRLTDQPTVAMTRLTDQPTAAMTRKQFYSLAGSTAGVVIVWAVNEFLAPLPVEISGAIVVFCGAAAGYYARERKVTRKRKAT